MARTISGIVEADGDKRSGVGFYSDRPSPGLYTIEFDQAFGQYPAVVCSAIVSIGESGNIIGFPMAIVNTVDRGRVRITTGSYTSAGQEVVHDNAFSFIAIGD